MRKYGVPEISRVPLEELLLQVGRLPPGLTNEAPKTLKF
jgi:hypothetical protein